MVQLAIRCHPFMPVSVDELEQWLESQVQELRAEAPHGTVRLSRLTQATPSSDLGVGWLVELELAEGERLLCGDRLADALRDMRLLGLQPTLLAPREVNDLALVSVATPAVDVGAGAGNRPTNGRAS
jgi:hypothetical protein